MNCVNTRYRTGQEEIMDDFDLKGKELEQTLKDLEKVNGMLGGNKITMNGIQKILKKNNELKSFSIIDVGCGNGAMLRTIADFGRKQNLRLKLIGLDANPFAIEIAERQSEDYPEISYRTMNVFSKSFNAVHGDIFLCTLTLHHFSDGEIIKLLDQFSKNARIGIVINDLQRSKWAYFLFHLYCGVFIRNKIAKEDGLVSILRSFRKKELQRYANTVPGHEHEISWKWAFRYQWILFNNKWKKKQT